MKMNFFSSSSTCSYDVLKFKILDFEKESWGFDFKFYKVYTRERSYDVLKLKFFVFEKEV